MQEIQISGTSFLDEDAQSYMGKIGLASKVFIFLVLSDAPGVVTYTYTSLVIFFGSFGKCYNLRPQMPISTFSAN